MKLERTNEPGIYRTTLTNGQTRYRVFWRENGRQYQRTASTLADARRLRARGITNDADGTTTVAKRGNRVIDLLEAFYQDRTRTGCHPKTLRGHRLSIDKRLRDAFGNRLVVSVDRHVIRQVVENWKSGPKPSGWAAINAALDTLSAAYRWGIDQQVPMASTNPAATYPRESAPARINRTLTDDEFSTLCANMASRRDRAIVCALATTGMRPGELFALRVEDIRPDGAYVRHTLRDNMTLGPPKNGKPRIVDLSEPARRNLAVLRGDRLSGFLVNHGDEPLTYKNWRKRQFYPARDLAGLHRMRIYDLRHVYASQAIAEGASVVHLQRQLGHAKPSITLDSYSFEFAKRDSRLTEQMSKRQAAFIA